MSKLLRKRKSVEAILAEFVADVSPLEKREHLYVLKDKRNGASYCECHVLASKLVALGTTDVPLDPDEQAEYRANRDVVPNAPAFERMKDDARKGRHFSNIVAQYTKDFDEDRPIKIIGGQHRFEAITEALDAGVDEMHGVKVYFDLNNDQRLDVQLISNTNIAVSADLFDRMQETMRGPNLRNWCQEVGLLREGQDFADRRLRGGPISVLFARTLITNYFRGTTIDLKKFGETETTPVICPTGQHDTEWDNLVHTHATLWDDAKLKEAGREFSGLVEAQRLAFQGKKPKPKPDFPEKALSPAILAGWAYVAGMLRNNEKRLRRHYALRNVTGKDPLNAAALAKGRHKSDPPNYRGLGYRSDPKERGRFVELFYNQAETGSGITPSAIDIAIKQFHAKQAQIEVNTAKEEARDGKR